MCSEFNNFKLKLTWQIEFSFQNKSALAYIEASKARIAEYEQQVRQNVKSPCLWLH